MIDRLGPLEWVLNTPSHHRVHHGRNPYCIDKNYGQPTWVCPHSLLHHHYLLPLTPSHSNHSLLSHSSMFGIGLGSEDPKSYVILLTTNTPHTLSLSTPSLCSWCSHYLGPNVRHISSRKTRGESDVRSCSPTGIMGPSMGTSQSTNYDLIWLCYFLLVAKTVRELLASSTNHKLSVSWLDFLEI